jgi:hypothetical protein
MQQNITQESENQAVRTDEDRIQVNVVLAGNDAARFRRYQEEQKLRQKGTAGYKLIVERLEQIDAEAGA